MSNVIVHIPEVNTYQPTIIGYGVMAAPTLVVNEQVVMSGRVPTKSPVADLLTSAEAGR